VAFCSSGERRAIFGVRIFAPHLKKRGSAWMIRKYWAGHEKTLLGFAISAMAVAALVWLGYEFWPLSQSGLKGGVDLSNLHRFTRDWFAGKAICRESDCRDQLAVRSRVRARIASKLCNSERRPSAGRGEASGIVFPKAEPGLI